MNFPGIFFYKVIFYFKGKTCFPTQYFPFRLTFISLFHKIKNMIASKSELLPNNYPISSRSMQSCKLLLISINIVYQWGRVLNYPVNVALWNCALISSHKAAKNLWQGLAAILLPVMHCMPHNSWTCTQSLRAKFEFSERLGNMTRTNFRKLFGVGWWSMHCITGLDMETKDERQ